MAETKLRPQISLADSRALVDKITDAAGVPIDEEFKDLVSVFVCLGFEVSYACAGNKGGDKNCTPFVEFVTAEPAGWTKSRRIAAAWRRSNQRQRARIDPLLGEFGTFRQDRHPLILQRVGQHGAFRLEPRGADSVSADSLDDHHRQFEDFAAFLRDKACL